MPDYLDVLAAEALQTIENGYYKSSKNVKSQLSLKNAIQSCQNAPIISEIKFASPSRGNLRAARDWKRIAQDMEKGGATGISILTEPTHFNGHIDYITEAREQVALPILMKDFILRKEQIDTASKIGASAILLIQSLFTRQYCENSVDEMIDYTHSKDLEVLLETHTEIEFLSALKTNADMIGINNRNLKTLEVDLEVTNRILTKNPVKGRVIISESGVNNSNDIRFLRECGAQAFLVGSSIMEAKDITLKVKELVSAL